MAIKVNTLRQKAEAMKGLIADRRLWLAADKKTVVEDSDPRAAFLLCAPGQTVSQADCDRLGLTDKAGKLVQRSTEKALPAAENKARKRAKDK
jgi:hypothetical protein